MNRSTEQHRRTLEEAIAEQLGSLSQEEKNIQDLLAQKKERAKEAQRRFREKNTLVAGKKVKPSFEELLPSAIEKLSAVGLEEALHIYDVPATIDYDEVDPLTLLTKMATVFSSLYLSIPPEPVLPLPRGEEMLGDEILSNRVIHYIHNIERKCKERQNMYTAFISYLGKPSVKALLNKYTEEDKSYVLARLDSDKKVYLEAATYLFYCKQLKVLFTEFHTLCNADGYENIREMVSLSIAEVKSAKDYKNSLGL